MFIDGNSIVHKMDPDLPPEIAVMFNPLGAGYRWAVEIPQTKIGDDILIMGPGQRGLASVIAAREAGAKNIIVTGLAADARKLKLAQEFGADYVIDVDNEDPVDRVLEITRGRGVDVVLDVSPYAVKPVSDALLMIRAGGTIVLAGVKGGKAIPNFMSDQVLMKEITIKGAIGVTSSGYTSAIRTIESGRVPIAKMHTHNFKLEEAELAIRTLAREIPGVESIHSCLIPEF
jgi:threonine dehydrogenase-like Zn-dependent dehydrogenase